jgi:hypothetical protein
LYSVLQAVLEGTIAKNLQLQKDLDTLALEVERLKSTKVVAAESGVNST